MNPIYSLSLFVACMVIPHSPLTAQHFEAHPCLSTSMMARQMQQQPELRRQHDKIERDRYQHSKQWADVPQYRSSNFTLPVVVHIVHQGGAENVSVPLVAQALSDLNQAFANTGYYDQGTSVDAGIQFCLAQQAPDGSPTDGINRIESPLTELLLESQDLALKDLSRWDPERYINIWLVRGICSQSSGCGVAGYAYLPALHGTPQDGIVMEARWFGSSPSNSAVLVHEMGHYLGLYHTFQGGCANDDCLLDGDRVCDTPPDQSTVPVPCGATVNSCTTDANSGFATDQNDMYWNYMDYSDFTCYSAFTQGQAERMAWHIEQVRSSLLTSEGCNPPCNTAISVSASADAVSVPIGSTVNFSSTATNASTYDWAVDGQSFGNAPTAVRAFNDLGTFDVILTVGNDDPNCSARDTLEIEVYCPVDASFSTSNLYPLPWEAVIFTNTDSTANSWEWSLNNQPGGQGMALALVFVEQGPQTICLQVSNGLCEETFCQTIFVNPPSDPDCGSISALGLGTQDLFEEGRRLVALPAGGFLLGGSRGDATLIARLDADLNLLWARTFKFTTFSEYIVDLKLDSEGYLIGTGSSSIVNNRRRNFAFRYDYENDNLLWGQVYNYGDQDRSIFEDIIEKAPGGNFIVAGDTWPNINPGVVCDALIMELDRNTGNPVWAKNAGMGNCDTYNRVLPHDGALYTIGRYNFSHVGANRMRAGMSRLDLEGNQEWTRLHLVNVQDNARLYSTNLVKDNGWVVAGWGPFQSDVLEQSVAFLYKTDFQGAVEWGHYYDILSSTSLFTSRLLELPDGYLLCGTYSQNGTHRLWLLKTDKQGDLQWANQYGTMISDSGWDVVFQNGHFYVLGSSDLTGDAITDIFLAKLNLDGSTVEDCDIMEPLNVQQINITNPYQGFHSLGVYDIPTSYLSPSTPARQQAGLQPTPICSTPPCTDTCAIAPNALLSSLSAACAGEQLAYTLEVCNEGQLPLPAGTPVAFYAGDPQVTTVPLLGVYELPEAIAADECRSFTALIAAPLDVPVYAIVNDAGTSPLPLDLADSFPNTDSEECDFSNNIGSYALSYTPPVLDLGPDQVLCANGIVELAASPGFTSYRWPDGSTGPNFTAYGPGTYWVEATDDCGDLHADTLSITTDPATQVVLGPDVSLCPSDTFSLSLSGFDAYQWFPESAVDCADCSSVTVRADSAMTIIVVAANESGCYSTDSLNVSMLPPVLTSETRAFCAGDTVLVFGQPVHEPGDYEMGFVTAQGCDSVHTITLLAAMDTLVLTEEAAICQGENYAFFGASLTEAGQYLHYDTSSSCVIITDLALTLLDTFRTEEARTICAGEATDIFGQAVGDAGTYAQQFMAQNGCDSLHTITLTVLDTLASFEERQICANESTDIFGQPTNEPGTYQQVFSAQNGCDSTHYIALEVLPVYATAEEVFLCEGDSVLVFGTFVTEGGVYEDTFTAVNGCDSVHTITVDQNPPIGLDLSLVPSCLGQATGSASAAISGGTPPYTYQWSTGETGGPALESLASGTYALSVYDTEDCVQEAEFRIEDFTAETAVVQPEAVSCYGERDGSIRIVDAPEDWLFSLDGKNYVAEPLFSNLPAGDYVLYFLQPEYECGLEIPFEITEPDELRLQLPGDTLIPLGRSLRLLAFANRAEGLSFAWSPSDGLDCADCLQPEARPLVTTQYTLTAVDSNGCTVQDQLWVSVEFGKQVYIPSAFSPNGDGRNDLFYLFGDESVSSIPHLQIFDRWGELLYDETALLPNQPDRAWDGRFRGQPMPAGIYVYVAKVAFINGRTLSFSGEVHLIR